jgi:hypothetical protein
VNELTSNRDLVLFEGFDVEPHETRHVHVFEQDKFVLFRHVFSVGIMFAVLTKQMVEIALPFVTTEIHADGSPILEGALIGQSF